MPQARRNTNGLIGSIVELEVHTNGRIRESFLLLLEGPSRWPKSLKQYLKWYARLGE